MIFTARIAQIVTRQKRQEIEATKAKQARECIQEVVEPILLKRASEGVSVALISTKTIEAYASDIENLVIIRLITEGGYHVTREGGIIKISW